MCPDMPIVIWRSRRKKSEMGGTGWADQETTQDGGSRLVLADSSVIGPNWIFTIA